MESNTRYENINLCVCELAQSMRIQYYDLEIFISGHQIMIHT